MTYVKISKTIEQDYLRELAHTEIKNLASIDELHEKLVTISNDLREKHGLWLMAHYRGEHCYGWDIKPGIFRPPFSTGLDLTKAREIERTGICLFRQRVIEEYGAAMLSKYTLPSRYGEDWQMLFQAQHAGVKTNLIDISTEIVNAAYFACEPSDHKDADGQLWCLLVPSEFMYLESSLSGAPCYPLHDPSKITKSFVCNVPSLLDDIHLRTYQYRLFRQHGRFVVTPDSKLDIPLNKQEFWQNMIVKVRIPASVKTVILHQLRERRITKRKLGLKESSKAKEQIELINQKVKETYQLET